MPADWTRQGNRIANAMQRARTAKLAAPAIPNSCGKAPDIFGLTSVCINSVTNRRSSRRKLCEGFMTTFVAALSIQRLQPGFDLPSARLEERRQSKLFAER